MHKRCVNTEESRCINLDSHRRLPSPSGLRQSMPSSSIDSCARVSETLPLSACGHTNRPRSSRFENRQSPSPSNHKQLDQIAAPATKSKHMAGERSLFERRLHQRAQPGEAAPHVGHARRNPDLRVRRRRDHASRHPQHRTQSSGVHRTRDANLPSRQRQLDRTSEATAAVYSGLACTSNELAGRHLASTRDRQQPHARRFEIASACEGCALKLSGLVQLAPVKHLVGVDSMSLRHGRNRYAGSASRFHDQPLLLSRPELTFPSSPHNRLSGFPW